MIRFALGLVPWWCWLLLGSVGAASAVTYHAVTLQRVRAEVRAEIALEVAQRDAEARRLANTANARVTDDYVKQVRAASGAAARARSDLERVRDELSAQQAAVTDAGSDESAAVTRNLLGECVGLLEASAASAAGLATQVRGLQGFVNEVCLAR